MCCYNYSPEELPTHVPFLSNKHYSLAARPEDESPTQHERPHYPCSWNSCPKSCPRCLLQRRRYPALRQWRFAALKAATLPRSRSGPCGERKYPCSSQDTYTQEPYSQSPPPPFSFLLESASPSAPRPRVFVLRPLPQGYIPSLSSPVQPQTLHSRASV